MGADLSASLGILLDEHRDRLMRMIHLRLDDRLRSRIDPADVMQEVALEAARRLGEYQRQADVPFFVWLRFLTAQKLAELHRRHFRAKSRSVSREASLFRGQLPDASSALLAAQLLGHATSPSEAAIRAEGQCRLQAALEQLTPADREIIVLRHFEQLSSVEASQVLGLNESTASTRHLRALQKLKRILSAMPEFREADLGFR